MADLDTKTFKSINGDDGGTWAPGSVITVGGAGMTVKLVGVNRLDAAAAFEINGFLSVKPSGNFECVGPSQFWGTTNFNSGGVSFSTDVHFYSPVTVTFDAGTTLSVNGSALIGYIESVNIVISDSLYTGPDSVTSINGSASINGPTNFYGSVTSTAPVNLADVVTVNDLTVNGALDITAVTSTSGMVYCTGSSRVVKNGALIHAGTTYISPGVAKNWTAQSLAGDATVQISDSGAVDGDELFISNRTTSHLVYVNDPDGNLIISLKAASGYNMSTYLQRILGSWYILDANFKT